MKNKIEKKKSFECKMEKKVKKYKIENDKIRKSVQKT